MYILGGSPVAQNTELQRKLEDNIKKGKEALGKTRNKVKISYNNHFLC